MAILPQFLKSTFGRKVHEYDDVYSFYFDRANIEYQAGQYTHLMVGRGNVHEFSFASAPCESELQLTMHLGSGSHFKRAMESLRPGGSVTFFKIKGQFVLPAEQTRLVVFIGGGVGMTPVRSLLVQAVHEGQTFERHLVQVQRGDYLYNGEVEDGLASIQRIRPEELATILAEVNEKNPEADYYVCGSRRFIHGVRDSLLVSNVSRDRLHLEDFEEYPAEATLLAR